MNTNTIHSLNQITISRSALLHNFRLCKELAQGAPLLPLVKADAYGHGLLDCARIFAKEGVAAFGVAEVVEGVRLREAGFTEPIFVLAGVIPQTLETIITYDLTPVVVDKALFPELSRLAGKYQKTVAVHLKLDAGMGRQGILPKDFAQVVEILEQTDHLQLAGVMAHFPMADDPSSDNSSKVLATFTETTDKLDTVQRRKCCLHLANSGGLFYVAGAQLNMVRPGISLYGYYPDGDQGRGNASAPLLQPAMRFSTQVIQVREVPRGHGLGYGHLFTTTRPTTIAVLPVGYEDGYLRILSNRAQVLVNGQRAPVVGRISMNLTLVDVTDVGSVHVGDEVVLLGKQGDAEITADDIATWMETINYEVLCLFGNLNDRKLVD
ncbi:alanine racemase [Desulfobulbus rhabdoformis]|uniref:alanine racemase n=1 Tax=Desulfobulbus rhabdoformis TaxID=34032 RepID=UPI001F05B5E8|nr:alanine racemase [Desulfobulbus rhabdoformis]